MRLRLMAGAAAVAASSLVLAGCVSSASNSSEASAPAASEAAPAASEAAPAASEAAPAASEAAPAGDPLTIGIVQAGSGFMGPIDTPARNALLMEV